jgi:hypothetical protein
MSITNITSSVAGPPRSACLVLAPLAAFAALATLATPASAQTAAVPTVDAEILVPPQGSATAVPLHVGTVCILSFPEKVAPHVVASSADFEIRPWGEDSIAVRTDNAQATPAPVARATGAGQINIKLTQRVVPASPPAVYRVRVKAAAVAEAVDAQVQAGLARRNAPIRQRHEPTP